MFRQYLALTVLSVPVLLGTGVQASELVATQITAANAARYVQEGPDAAGGIGDWVLSNGSVCAIVSNIDHESELSVRGGVLIDLGFCGRADDHYVGAQDLIDSSRETPVNIDRIDAKVGPSSAVIRTFGGQGGVVVETSYRLDADNPTTLFVQKRLTQRADQPSVALYTSVFFNYHSMTPFVASTRDPSRSNGFVQENFVSRGPTEIETFARTADLIVALSPPDVEAPIAYGWQMRSAVRYAPDGTETDLPFYALADFSALSFLSLSEPFLFGDGRELGLTQLLEVPFTDLAAGDEIIFEEAIMLAPRSDVAGITDQVYAAAPRVSGQVSDTSAVLHIDRADGVPFTQTRVFEDGTFRAQLPTGDYLLRVAAPGGRTVLHTFSVGEGDLDLGLVTIATPQHVLLPQGQPMRLVFHGVGDTEDPRFGDDLLGAVELQDDGLEEKNGTNQIFLMGTDLDPRHAVLPAGQYRVYATRGPEFSLEQADLTVEAGNDTVLEINVPVRAVDTPRYIAGDFHVHSGPSFDNAFAPTQRVATFIAEGGEVLVAAEHETIFDFQPVIDAMGVGDRIVTVTGTEITSEVPSLRAPHTIGHANAFPVVADPLAFRRGAFANENRRWREVMDDIRARRADTVVQLNHARADDRFAPGADAWDEEWSGDNGTYFDHLGVGTPFNAGVALDEGAHARLVERDPVTGTRDIDFDAVEVLNGPARDADIAMRRDWLSLVAQGFTLTATANSDSHNAEQQVAMPRNMVAVSDDRLAAFDERSWAVAVREGRTYGTTGPMLDVALEGTGIGGTFAGSSGILSVSVDAAPWIEVSRLELVVNGAVRQSMSVVAGDRLDLPLSFVKDSFVVVEVYGEAGEDYLAVYPKLRPYAFINPIYVDADGDGTWTPPGLPE